MKSYSEKKEAAGGKLPLLDIVLECIIGFDA